MREIGVSPKTGEKVFARYGKFGPMLQLGDGENDVKPKFAPLPAGERIETVNLEQALKMFELPKVIGQPLMDKISQPTWPFWAFCTSRQGVFLNKTSVPHDITVEEALKIIAIKKKKMPINSLRSSKKRELRSLTDLMVHT